ncbi:MAG: IclR family transcriptional regulator [Thermodesulfobacteriota bacterium]
MTENKDEKDRVKSLEKALGLLILLGDSSSSLSLDQLTQQAGLKKTSCFRLLRTMMRLGFVEQEAETKNYHLGSRNISIGAAALNSLSLRRTALPYMRELRKETGETVNLAILEGTEIVFVERLESEHILSTHHKVGDRLPVHCTCMGKSLLAFLPEHKLNEVLSQIRFTRRTPRTITSREAFLTELKKVRAQGLAVNVEELEPGLGAVAGPIRNHRGEAVASINIAFPTIRHDPKQAITRFAPKVKEACLAISRSLGFQEP